MTTYNFYIQKKNLTSNEVKIYCDYPIICEDKERLSVKLVDFKYLNSAYNISDALHNNYLSVKRRIPPYQTYNITNVGTNFTSPLHNIGKSTFLDTAIKSSSLETMEESFFDVDYDIHYGTQNILEGYTPQGVPIFAQNIVKNNFRDGFTTNLIPFDKINNNYIKIYKKNTATFADSFMLQSIYVRMDFNNVNTYTTPTTITLRVQGSMDNITYTTLTTTNNVLTFPASVESAETYIAVSGGNYSYYKVDIANISPAYDPYIIYLYLIKFFKADTTITNVPEEIIYENITIPNGFYNIDTLIQKINNLSTNITLSKQDASNKLIINNESAIATINIALPPITITEQRSLIFPNKSTAYVYGFNNLSYSLNTTPLISDTYVNLMNFSKLIISTNLDFNVKTNNDISNDENPHTRGIGNILEWVDVDEIPMTCVKYKNVENISHKIDNKYISEFSLLFCNEKSLPIIVDNLLIHLQIIKYKK